MAQTATKSVALTVAAGVLTFAVQRLSAGDLVTAAVGLLVGTLLFAGYQYAENADHAKAYDDVVGAIGEDTFKRLSELSADQLERLDGDAEE